MPQLKELKNLKDWKKAGTLAAQTLQYGKTLIKKGASILEIAEKIEEKINKAGAIPAFPANISLNEIAAHYTPSYNEERKLGEDLVKLDIGVCINGCIADTALTIDLTENNKHKELIQASQSALKEAIKLATPGTKLCQIGKAIENTIESFNLVPIRNLFGHEIKKYQVHAGTNIPNFDNNSQTTLKENQIIAIEPFATSGVGEVQDGKSSNDFSFIEKKPIRDPTARKIQEHIQKQYKELPFASRWLVKEFTPRAIISLKFLEQAEAVHHYKELIESSKHPVSQAEHTVLVADKPIVLTASE